MANPCVDWLSYQTSRCHSVKAFLKASLVATMKQSVMADCLWKAPTRLSAPLAIQCSPLSDNTPKHSNRTILNAIKGISIDTHTYVFISSTQHTRALFYDRVHNACKFHSIVSFWNNSIFRSINEERSLRLEFRCCPANMSVFFPLSAISALTGVFYFSLVNLFIVSISNNQMNCWRWTSQRDSIATINHATGRIWSLHIEQQFPFRRRVSSGED